MAYDLGDPLDPGPVAAEIDREIRALPAKGVQPVRAVRRAWTRRLRAAREMVVKALSWALRELVVWDPDAVRRFLDDHYEVLAARVRREVRSKLETGRKHPARRAT